VSDAHKQQCLTCAWRIKQPHYQSVYFITQMRTHIGKQKTYIRAQKYSNDYNCYHP